MKYSGTPLFRTSEMWTSRFNRCFALVRIAFPLTGMRTPRYSINWTSSSVPLVPGLYIIHWIMRTLTYLSCKFVRHRLSIQQQWHWFAYFWRLVSLSRKRTARESSRTCLRSTQQHGYALPRLLEIYRKPPKYGHLYNRDTQQWSHGVRNTGVPLYMFMK